METQKNRFSINTGIGPMTDKLINNALDTITSGNFQKKVIPKLIDPVSVAIQEKIRPYIYVGFGLYAIIVILLLIIIYITIYKKR